MRTPLNDDLKEPITVAAVLLLRQKRRNRPGHCAHSTAPRRCGRQYHYPPHYSRSERLAKPPLSLPSTATEGSVDLHNAVYDNDNMYDNVCYVYYNVRNMDADYGVLPGAPRPDGPWPDGIG